MGAEADAERTSVAVWEYSDRVGLMADVVEVDVPVPDVEGDIVEQHLHGACSDYRQWSVSLPVGILAVCWSIREQALSMSSASLPTSV